MRKAFVHIPVIAGSFCCWSVMFLNEFYSGPSWAPHSIAFLALYFLASVLALWAVGDAARRRRAVPYDFGTFVFFAWFVVLPVYLAKTRGWRAGIPVFVFIAIYCSAAFFSAFISLDANP